MVSNNTICLWYDGTALDTAKFYAETFPDSRVGAVLRAPSDYPAGKQGDVLTVFTVMGISCLGQNGAGLKPTKLSRSRLRPTARLKWIGCETRLLETAVKKANVVGARTSGDCRGRSRHVP